MADPQPPMSDPPVGWTVPTYAAMNESLRRAEQRFYDERDRRYAEVSLEKEKALRIKEEADKAALALAREIQTYKDEKANELRAQINSERGLYATRGDLQSAIEKIEATLKPVQEFVTSQRGKQQGFSTSGAILTAVVGGVAGLVGIVVAIIVATQ